MSSTRVGFAGLGLMGVRMARQFVDKGFPLAVWSRDAKKAEPLVAKGAKQTKTPKELAEASDVVVACVADPAAVERVVFAEDGVLAGARPGFRYVETSTVSPALTKRLADAFRAKGADALEAPMTGSKNGADKGTLLFMCGGKKSTFDELQPVLMAMGTKAVYCGEMGAGATVKLIGNTFITFMLEALSECSVIAKKAGVPLETMLEVVQSSGFASPYYNFKGQALLKRDFEQHFSIDLLVKDQGLMLAESHSLRASMPGLGAIREVFEAARGQGLGQEDIGAVVKVLERAAGL
jgi:3-hydroxyisobutyrate dehydrogenase-like beta-hydroxyacid dehydrogenase